MFSRLAPRTRSTIEGALFDLSILTLTDDLYVSVLQECLKAQKRDLSSYHLGPVRGRDHLAIITEIVYVFRLEETEIPRLAAHVLGRFAEREASELQLHPAADAFLRAVRLLGSQALLVPGTEDRTQRVLERFGWKDRFQVCQAFGTQNGLLMEANEGNYVKAAAALKDRSHVKARNCFALAGSKAGVDAARGAGLGKVIKIPSPSEILRSPADANAQFPEDPKAWDVHKLLFS